MHTHSHDTHGFVPYVGEFEFAEDSQWGAVVLHLASRVGNTHVMRDPEAIRCHETGRVGPGKAIALGKRMYTNAQVGVLDGPLRYQPKPDPLHWATPTTKARMSKRQRRTLRKRRRAAKRNGLPFDETVEIRLITA